MSSLLMPFVVRATEVADSRLARMGLSQDDFASAVLRCLVAYKKGSPMHPVTHAGVTAWGEAVAALRERLMSKADGWAFEHKYGLSLSFNKERQIALIVTSGDKDTGLMDGKPKTKNKKGSRTRDVVSSNRTRDLFDEPDVVDFERYSSRADGNQTWVLLYHIDKAKKEIRYELSLPSGVSSLQGKEEHLRIDDWGFRIVFNPVPFSSAVLVDDKREALKKSDKVSFDFTKKV